MHKKGVAILLLSIFATLQLCMFGQEFLPEHHPHEGGCIATSKNLHTECSDHSHNHTLHTESPMFACAHFHTQLAGSCFIFDKPLTNTLSNRVAISFVLSCAILVTTMLLRIPFENRHLWQSTPKAQITLDTDGNFVFFRGPPHSTLTSY